MKEPDPKENRGESTRVVDLQTLEVVHSKDPWDPLVDKEDQLLRNIASAIGELPDLKPPEELLSSVMEAILIRRLPWWIRYYRWVTSIRHLAVTPRRFALAAPILMMVLASGLFFFKDGGILRLWEVNAPNIPVVFILNLPEATSVSVIGTFNSWEAKGYEMQWDQETNTWYLSASLPLGRHEYAFLVDGLKIIPDPKAILYQEDGFGNRNAVLILGNGNGQNI